MQLTDLRAIIRYTTVDATEWPNATLDAWIGQAVRFYSAHFPRRWRKTLTLTTGTQAYALPGGHGFMGVLAVRYPSTDETFLDQANEWDRAFLNADEVYAIRSADDSTAVNADDSAGSIVFAQTVTTGQYALIDYLGAHLAPVVGDDDFDVTVPDAHLEAITAYVEFMAHLKSETDQTYVASDVAVALAQLSDGARRCWNRYKDIMDRLAWLGLDRTAAQATALPNWSYT